MKRRLFLKRTGMAVAGFMAGPALLSSCKPALTASATKFTAFPGLIPDFKAGAEVFDDAIAELRLFGAGPIIPAEAEVSQFGLDDVAEQIIYGAETPAELHAEFERYGSEMIGAAAELAEATSEFPEIEAGSSEYADIAENFSLLKISKSSAVLHASTEVHIPHPERAVVTKTMFAEAEIMYQALQGEFPDVRRQPQNNAELAFAGEQLLGNAELYVGSSEMISSTQEFLPSTGEFVASAAESFLGTKKSLIKDFDKGADFLLAASQNIELSSELYAQGVETFNLGELIVNGAEESSAPHWVKPARLLVGASEVYTRLAKGAPAALEGAETMVQGAQFLVAEAEANAEALDAETLLFGAEQYISGSTMDLGQAEMNQQSGRYLSGAEKLARGKPGGLAEMLTAAVLNVHGAIDYGIGAEGLYVLRTAEGIVSVLPAAEALLTGAEIAGGEAKNAEAEFGAIEMIGGAELMTEGAEMVMTGSGEGVEGVELLAEGEALIAEGGTAEAQGEVMAEQAEQVWSYGSAEVWEGGENLNTGSMELRRGTAEFAIAEK